MIDNQSFRRRNIDGKIIIKEERTRKVSEETLSFKQRKRREREIFWKDLTWDLR